MSRRRKILARALVLLGIFVVAIPFISVARLQQQVLDEVPLPDDAAIVVEETPGGALFDSDFVLAYRYVTASVEEVEQTLIGAGFEANGIELEGRRTFALECCGSYDAVFVSVFEGADGTTNLRYTVFDDDVVSTWWFISGLGLAMALVGFAMAGSKRSSEPSAFTAPPPLGV